VLLLLLFFSSSTGDSPRLGIGSGAFTGSLVEETVANDSAGATAT
jgi:hypothetical protein